MARARVVQVSPEQVTALPPAVDDGGTYAGEVAMLRQARLPFWATFIAIGGYRELHDQRDWDAVPYYACLLVEGPEFFTAVPFINWGGRVFGLGHLAAARSERADELMRNGGRDRLLTAGYSVEEAGAAIEGVQIVPWDDPHSGVGHYDHRTVIDNTSAMVTIGSCHAARVVYMLESANVDLAPVAGLPRGHRGHGVPHFDVKVKQATRRPERRDVPSRPGQWSHRWEVRGHYKHFTKGPIFDANPDRRVAHGGEECVRVWCPPFVKGPDDKPLIPKRRVVAA